MKFIANKNGAVYQVIGEEQEYSFLSCCGYNQYVVAWKLHSVGDNLYEWEQGHYFFDIGSACDCFSVKTAPFDPPYMVTGW